MRARISVFVFIMFSYFPVVRITCVFLLSFNVLHLLIALLGWEYYPIAHITWCSFEISQYPCFPITRISLLPGYPF